MKTEHSHTPGPWAIQFAPNGHPYRIVRPSGDDKLPGSLGTTITRWGTFMVPSCSETLANAKLIASSPELLSAAQKVFAAMTSVNVKTLDESLVLQEACKELQRVISLATQ